MVFNAAKKRQGYIILYRIGLKDMHMIFPILFSVTICSSCSHIYYAIGREVGVAG